MLTSLSGLIISYELGLKPGGTIVLLAVLVLLVIFAMKKVVSTVGELTCDILVKRVDGGLAADVVDREGAWHEVPARQRLKFLELQPERQ